MCYLFRSLNGLFSSYCLYQIFIDRLNRCLYDQTVLEFGETLLLDDKCLRITCKDRNESLSS